MRGYIYTLEVLLAVATIMIAIVLVFSATPEEPETGVVVIKQSGYDALWYLDQTGELRDSVRDGALNEVLANLTYMLPASIDFDASICTYTCSSTLLPTNRTVVAVDYYVSGYRDDFINGKVRLWMWEKF